MWEVAGMAESRNRGRVRVQESSAAAPARSHRPPNRAQGHRHSLAWGHCDALMTCVLHLMSVTKVLQSLLAPQAGSLNCSR